MFPFQAHNEGDSHTQSFVRREEESTQVGNTLVRHVHVDVCSLRIVDLLCCLKFKTQSVRAGEGQYVDDTAVGGVSKHVIQQTLYRS